MSADKIASELMTNDEVSERLQKLEERLDQANIRAAWNRYLRALAAMVLAASGTAGDLAACRSTAGDAPHDGPPPSSPPLAAPTGP